MFLGYAYKYNGGCASSTELFPASIITQNEESPEACYALCQMTYNCKYFEYDFSGSKCHLHPSGITKGNGYPNVKCYKIDEINCTLAAASNNTITKLEDYIQSQSNPVKVDYQTSNEVYNH